jgi:pSer/pThr/pTyr-binding forkhead associated (FHA) protein
VITGDRAVVEDLGSKNGTQVHRRRIAAPVDLVDGDEIQIGSIVVTFRMPSRPGSTTSLF